MYCDESPVLPTPQSSETMESWPSVDMDALVDIATDDLNSVSSFKSADLRIPTQAHVASPGAADAASPASCGGYPADVVRPLSYELLIPSAPSPPQQQQSHHARPSQLLRIRRRKRHSAPLVSVSSDDGGGEGSADDAGEAAAPKDEAEAEVRAEAPAPVVPVVVVATEDAATSPLPAAPAVDAATSPASEAVLAAGQALNYMDPRSWRTLGFAEADLSLVERVMTRIYEKEKGKRAKEEKEEEARPAVPAMEPMDDTQPAQVGVALGGNPLDAAIAEIMDEHCLPEELPKPTPAQPSPAAKAKRGRKRKHSEVVVGEDETVEDRDAKTRKVKDGKKAAGGGGGEFSVASGSGGGAKKKRAPLKQQNGNVAHNLMKGTKRRASDKHIPRPRGSGCPQSSVVMKLTTDSLADLNNLNDLSKGRYWNSASVASWALPPQADAVQLMSG